MKSIFALILTLFIASIASAAPATGPSTQPVTVEQLIKAGQATLQALDSGQAQMSWTTRITTNQLTVEVTNTVDGAQRYSHMVMQQARGGTQDLSTIIQKDGRWYVNEMGFPMGVYRPYEPPLTFPLSYIYLSKAHLQVLANNPDATVESVAGDVVNVRVPLGADAKALIQSSIDSMQKYVIEASQKPVAKIYQEKVDRLKQSMNEGQLVKVDLNSGVILNDTSGAYQCNVASLSTHADIDQSLFDTSNTRWDDFTSDPTAVPDLDNLLMISSAPLATAQNVLLYENLHELCLANIQTGQVRHLPFSGGSASSGCFSRDRKKVYLGGMTTTSMGVFEVNLSTGENRRIAAADLPEGLFIMPALSHDGNQLTVLHMQAPFEVQVYLVDLKANTARKLGEPMNTYFLAWLDNDQGLILVSRKLVSMDEPTEDSVARMDLDGKVTVLTKGRQPQLIPGKNRILFEQDDLWNTCDLEGKNIELYADGMKGFGAPAISPDGSRIIWMQFAEGKLPQPVIQAYGKPTVRELDLGDGLWAYPAWK